MVVVGYLKFNQSKISSQTEYVLSYDKEIIIPWIQTDLHETI